MIQPAENTSLKNGINVKSFNFDIIDNTIIFYENSSPELIKALQLSTVFSQAAARAASLGTDSNITSEAFYSQLTKIYNDLSWINISTGIASLPINFGSEYFITAFTKIASGLTQDASLNIQAMFEFIFENSLSDENLRSIMDFWWYSSTREQGKINFGIGVFLPEVDNTSATLRCNYFNFDIAKVYNKHLLKPEKKLDWAKWRSFFEKYNHYPLPYNTSVRNFYGKLDYAKYLPKQESLKEKISTKQEEDHVKSYSFS